MPQMSDLVQRLLEDFVLVDGRLGDHPKVRAVVLWMDGQLLVPVASTLNKSTGTYHLGGQGESLTKKVYEGSSYAVLSKFRETTWTSPVSGTEVRSWLAVPLPGIEGPSGVVSFYSSKTGLFQDRDLGLAQCLGALIAYVKLHIEPRASRPSAISVALGKGLRVVREEIRLTQAALAERVGTSRIAISKWENGAQPPSKGSLVRWCEALGLLSPDSPTIVSVTEVSPQLLKMLQRDPTLLTELSPDQFEKLVAERLNRMGFEVRLTGGINRRDGGIDLIAVPRTATLASFLLAGQVKHHRGQRRTGRDAVDRLLAWKESYFTIGLLVTNTGFTRDALWLASQERHKGFVRLRDFTDLKRWLADNFWAADKWREIPEAIELAPGVTVSVPKPKLGKSLEIWPMGRLEDEDGA